jgi:hypothetical protein
MPRYLIERTFPRGLVVADADEGAASLARIVNVNAGRGVTWLHSYVSPDKTRSYCVYDAPSAEVIREVAGLNALPVGCITEVSVLDPYRYR